MYFNHALAGALAVKPILDKHGSVFTDKERNALWFIGITSAVLPDFDIAYSTLTGLSDHRSFVTHGIFIYLIIFLLLYAIGRFQKKEIFGRKFFKVMSMVFIAGVSTHFLIDFIVGGTALFAPFDYSVYGFDMKLNNSFDNRLSQYLVSNYMLIELLVASLFLLFFRGKKYFVPRFFSLFYFLIATLSFIMVSTVFF